MICFKREQKIKFKYKIKIKSPTKLKWTERKEFKSWETKKWTNLDLNILTSLRKTYTYQERAAKSTVKRPREK